MSEDTIADRTVLEGTTVAGDAISENGCCSADGAAGEATALVEQMACRARVAQRRLACATRQVKDAAIMAMAQALVANSDAICAANRHDVARAREQGMSEGLIDRLMLDRTRVEAIVDSLREIATLTDPVGEMVDGQTLSNGLRVHRQRVPLGVVGVIYEARPNVTVDVTALALKSGNAVLLRGGSAAQQTNAAVIDTLREALVGCGLPADLCASVDECGRAGATALMRARGLVDVLVPRGGAGLIAAVVESSTVPVIETGAGNCHVYVHASADLDKAIDIIVNAKTQRVGVCNAAETLLVDAAVAAQYLPRAARALWDRGVVLHADPHTQALLGNLAEQTEHQDALVAATEDDWATEYGSLDLAVRVVEDLTQALDHIRRYSTGHTEAILARDVEAIRRATAGIDSAVVMVNASTRFTDGGQLGLGAELGISTQKLHTRGPMGLSALTTTQWVVEGEGHVRP